MYLIHIKNSPELSRSIGLRNVTDFVLSGGTLSVSDFSLVTGVLLFFDRTLLKRGIEEWDLLCGGGLEVLGLNGGEGVLDKSRTRLPRLEWEELEDLAFSAFSSVDFL